LQGFPFLSYLDSDPGQLSSRRLQYVAQYLNPPLSPMMIIDRDGNVYHLEYGLKETETLKKHLEPYLKP
jgi:hypothetical protein